MAIFTICNVDEEIKTQLRIRAAKHGRSMEEEARIILSQAVRLEDSSTNLADTVRAKLAEMGLSEADIDEAKAWARRA